MDFFGEHQNHNVSYTIIVLIGWSHWFTIYLGFRLFFHLFRVFFPNLTVNSLKAGTFSLQFYSSVQYSALDLEYCRECECLVILGNSSINRDLYGLYNFSYQSLCFPTLPTDWYVLRYQCLLCIYRPMIIIILKKQLLKCIYKKVIFVLN